jgi:hypothetical protein
MHALPPPPPPPITYSLESERGDGRADRGVARPLPLDVAEPSQAVKLLREISAQFDNLLEAEADGIDLLDLDR